MVNGVVPLTLNTPGCRYYNYTFFSVVFSKCYLGKAIKRILLPTLFSFIFLLSNVMYKIKVIEVNNLTHVTIII